MNEGIDSSRGLKVLEEDLSKGIEDEAGSKEVECVILKEVECVM
jgi:hypothetical protein